MRKGSNNQVSQRNTQSVGPNLYYIILEDLKSKSAFGDPVYYFNRVICMKQNVIVFIHIFFFFLYSVF